MTYCVYYGPYMMKATDLVYLAQLQIGVKEQPANSNRVFYNTEFYNKEVSGAQYPWCCVFMWYIFKGTDLFPKTASCANALDYFEKNDQIVKTPKVGDVVFFKFSKKNKRRTDHVGLVVGVAVDYFITIEGNTGTGNDTNGGCVMYRRREFENVVAFARPKYEV